LDFDSFVLLPGTINAWPGMQMLVEVSETAESASIAESADSLDSDQERDMLPLPPDSGVLLEPQMMPLSFSPPAFYPDFIPHPYMEYNPMGMPLYMMPNGSAGWRMRIKKKKASKYRKKKTGEFGSPNHKKKHKKKLKKKEALADGSSDNTSWSLEASKRKNHKNKNKNRGQGAGAGWGIPTHHRNDGYEGGWPISQGLISGAFRQLDFAPPGLSESPPGSVDSWARFSSQISSHMGGFSQPHRPEWLNPTTPLPLYAQVF